jgi:hypothetical protein
MKEKLVALLKEHIACETSAEQRDAIAEDIMAVIIREITPFKNDSVEDVEHAVLSVYNDKLGVSLHNLLWIDDTVPGAHVERISKAMIQTMLTELPGELLKRRLRELNEKPLVN